MSDVLSCPWYPRCSGCDHIGVPYEQQLAAKLEAVRDVFAQGRLRDFDPLSITTIHPSPRRAAYRNRVKLVAARRTGDKEQINDGGGVALGLYREDSHEVVNIPSCPVHDERINRVIEVVRSGISDVGLPLYDEATLTGELRFVTVRAGVAIGEVLVGLITSSDCGAEVEALAKYIVQHDASVVGALQNMNPAAGNVVFGRQTRLLTGQGFIEEIVCGVRVRLGLTSFFQVNTGVAEATYAAIHDRLRLTGNDVLLDLYCGVGVIGLTAAGQVSRVLGIEEVPEAVHFAIDAAKASGVRNAEFHVGRVEEKLPRILKTLGRSGVQEGVLKVAVNPPRKGIAPAVVEAICDARPTRIAYLSCSPPTLVRDLRMFERGRYRVESVELFDMFPQTDKVETLAALGRTDDLPAGIVRRRRRA